MNEEFEESAGTRSAEATDRRSAAVDSDREDRLDPIAAAVGGSRDLYDVATWDPRSHLDRAAVRVYDAWSEHRRRIVLAVVGAILFLQIAIGVLLWILIPALAVFTLLSVVPAFLLVSYVWFADGTIREPLKPMAGTFVLGTFAGGLAIIVNGSFDLLLGALVAVLIAPPTEELAKLAAVRLFAYRTEHFTTVFDGAVYGALAGLGFATIENTLYIAQFAGVVGVTSITMTRAIAAPGHVIWSAIAGYYLGLAKFNPDHRGPIVVKGLLVATLFHVAHNASGSIASGDGQLLLILGLLALAGFVLLRKLHRYRATYREVFGSEPRVLFPRRDDAPPEPIQAVPDPFEQLKKLQELHRIGLVTDEEFDDKRRAILEEL